MALLLLGIAQQAPEEWAVTTPDWTRAIVAVIVVLALAAGFAWLLRRGSLGALGRRGRSVTAETVALLGDRRSLVIVSVEGRRLLLGLTPASVSLVAELAPSPTFDARLDQGALRQEQRAQ